jgi:hypothetical protein
MEESDMRSLCVLLLSLVCVASASATVLWDQSQQLADYWVQTPIVTSQEFPPPDPFGAYSSYTMNDVATDGQDWVIEGVTVYYSRFSTPSPWQDVVSQARLSVIPKTGALPDNTFDPTTGQLVNVTLTPFTQDNVDYLAITATGLNIPLSAGEYWVGLVPLAPLASIGYYQEVPVQTSVLKESETAWRNPLNGFGAGTDWMPWDVPGSDWLINTDQSITITGVPEPASLFLVALGTLMIVRRR